MDEANSLIASTFRCFSDFFGCGECKPLTNRQLLQLSALSFFIFVIAELLGAIISNSLSLLGDVGAMSVDVLSYFTNLYAEHVKETTPSLSLNMRFLLEVCVPSFSVACLLAVTVYVTLDAIVVLENPPDINDVDVAFLYGFASANFVVDIICTSMFYMRGDDAFLEKSTTVESIKHIDRAFQLDEIDEFGMEAIDPPSHYIPSFQRGGVSSHEDIDNKRKKKIKNKIHEKSKISKSIVSVLIPTFKSLDDTDSHTRDSSSDSDVEEFVDDGDVKVKKNLNMLSASTHVVGDTLRTISVIIAALTSSITGVDGDICDAWAAIIVALTIFLIVIPLLRDIVCSALDIWDKKRNVDCGYSQVGIRLHTLSSSGIDKEERTLINK